MLPRGTVRVNSCCGRWRPGQATPSVRRALHDGRLELIPHTVVRHGPVSSLDDDDFDPYDDDEEDEYGYDDEDDSDDEY